MFPYEVDEVLFRRIVGIRYPGMFQAKSQLIGM
jgi:hypothetical protein